MAKVKSITPLNDGLSEPLAQELWDKIVLFAGYSFNKSHAVAYSLIAWQTMWLKAHYPQEFFAAALTVAKTEDMPALIRDAGELGISVLPPDFNTSTDRFVVLDDKTLVAPFSAMNGISTKKAQVIVEERDKLGPVTSLEDFAKRDLGRGIGDAIKQKLLKVGALCSVDPLLAPALDESRRQDQLEICPSIMTEGGVYDRPIDVSKATIEALAAVISDFKAKEHPCLANKMLTLPKLGTRAKFMVIFDAPSWKEERNARFSNPMNESVDEALKLAELEVSDGYWTGLHKTPKPKSGSWSKDETSVSLQLLRDEIAVINPQIIVLLGSMVVRELVPGLKGAAFDHVLKVVYQPATVEKLSGGVSKRLKDDRNLILGFNPSQCYHDANKAIVLNELFERVAGLIAE